MEIRLVKPGKLAIIPAGIIEDIELRYYNNQKWVLYCNTLATLHNTPQKIQKIIWEAFKNDKRNQVDAESMRNEEIETCFEEWYKRAAS